MKVSALIEVLNKYKEEHGDIDFSLIDSSDDYGEADLAPVTGLEPNDDTHIRCLKNEYDGKNYLVLASDSDFDLYERTLERKAATSLWRH
jgi:hypothetical protein